jgi:hypothetical protein
VLHTDLADLEGHEIVRFLRDRSYRPIDVFGDDIR